MELTRSRHSFKSNYPLATDDIHMCFTGRCEVRLLPGSVKQAKTPTVYVSSVHESEHPNL